MKDLSQLIRDNPGAVFTVDNDDWWMIPAPPKPIAEMTPEDHDAWQDSELANASDVVAKGDGGYGSGSSYGAEILQALAEIVGVKIQSV